MAIGRERRAVLLHTTIATLRDLGGHARARDVLDRVGSTTDLTEEEREDVKSGVPRWEVHVRWYTVDCVRAGWLVKSAGYWTLTEAGKEALSLAPSEFQRRASAAYDKWKSTQPSETAEPNLDERPEVQTQLVYDKAIETAAKEIEDHINALDEYEFQQLVAELLIAMGYHVPYVAPPGKDGGIDVVAYRDPLGATLPRIMVQVKHRIDKMGVKEVRELEGLLRRDGDIGIIVSSGGFSNEVNRELRSATKHIEKIDLARLIHLWQQNYDKLRETGRQLMPLVQVSFLAPQKQSE